MAGLQIDSNVKYVPSEKSLDDVNSKLNIGELAFGLIGNSKKMAIAGKYKDSGTELLSGTDEATLKKIVQTVIQEEIVNILNTAI